MDVAFCLLALPVAFPLMAICVLAVCIDSPGPVLFIQERIGRGGRRFRLYKFRTMHSNLDDRPHREFMRAYVRGQISDDEGENRTGDSFYRLTAKPPVAGTLGENGRLRVYKPVRNAEITWAGRILRRTSLDELPQVFNVLKGEMSLVGPRPNVPWEVEVYRGWHYERLEVLPGITGLAQVRGRSGIPFDHIVAYDIEYVERRSLALDLKILGWTLFKVLSGTGAE
jgi:lipopolysaccharide/colanic/teichoic acid biosynthesis glycosyltransferase